jgi:hypothetical protein
VRGGYRDISFQHYFSPSSHLQEPEPVFLLIQDLQELDDLFEIKWFWAKDSKGLECLNQAETLSLGLDEPRQSDQICLYLRRVSDSKSPIWRKLQIFHEFFGFPADSPDIPRCLDLPVASLKWDGEYLSFLVGFSRLMHTVQITGDENGPLTPWELITTNGTTYVRDEGDEYRHLRPHLSLSYNVSRRLNENLSLFSVCCF